MTKWVKFNSSSTIPLAISLLRPRLSAVEAISSRMKLMTFSLPFFPDISTAVAAPIKPPPVINIFSQDNEISAPAEIARLFINATVGTSAPKIASFI